jgi:hypothetical protein
LFVCCFFWEKKTKKERLLLSHLDFSLCESFLKNFTLKKCVIVTTIKGCI